jgi:hypothetical protein
MNYIYKKDNKWYFDLIGLPYGNRNEEENGYPELKDADAKILKYTILRLKNNPEYFKPDGYKRYFYDTMGNVLKTILATDNVVEATYRGGCRGFGVSDNQIQLYGGTNGPNGSQFKNPCLITIENGYLEMSDTDFGVKYLGKLKHEIDDMVESDGEYANYMAEQTFKDISEKMLGFVRILEQ